VAAASTAPPFTTTAAAKTPFTTTVTLISMPGTATVT
jgi:hypothetical protein